MTMEQDPRLVEDPVRLSTSKLWKIQKNYFDTMGIRAWKEEVPFYISSNAFTANRYALQVVKFIRDWHSLKKTTQNDTFYLLEVGSGTGKFSYLFLKTLKELLREYNLENQKFCYVISDLAENNLTFCLENQSFKPFIDNGECDFACFNVEEDSDFTLRLKQKKYSELNVKTPFIVIANYTLDCIAQDEFEYKDGKFYEIKLGLKSRYKNFDIQKAMHLNELRLSFVKPSEETNIDNYYEKPELNEILAGYPQLFNNKRSRIGMPVGAVKFFDNMKALTKNNFFMMVGDKGLTQPRKFPLYDDKYRFSYDGCYSFLVNFHAIGEYVKKSGGDYLLSKNSNDFKVNLYCMGATFSELVETKAFFEKSMEVTGPEEFCHFFDEYLTSNYRFSIKSLLAFIRFSEWDPNAYAIVHDRMIELISGASVPFVEDLKEDLKKVSSNVYRMNIGDDVYNLIGMFFQIQEEDDIALELYEKSLSVFGDKAAPHNNMGMIYEKQKNIPKALFHFQRSVELDKNNRFAKKRIHHLSGKPYLALISPVIKGLFVGGLIVGALYLISH